VNITTVLQDGVILILWSSVGLLSFPLAALVSFLKDRGAKLKDHAMMKTDIAILCLKVIALGPIIFCCGITELIKVWPNRDTKEKFLLRKL
jgi:hypothetical protein